MKTRFFIIAGISVAVFLIGVIVYPYINETTFEDYSSHDIKSALDISAIPDSVCFVMDRESSTPASCADGNCACYPLSDFETLGCTKPILEHLDRHTNLLDENFNGNVYRNLIGLPEDVSEEEYDKCFDTIFEKRKFMAQKMEFESFSIVQGTKIELEGVIVDMRLGSAHQYSLFTNDPHFTFSTGSNGIKLEGLHDENDLNGKIVKLSGTRMQRDLGIHVNSYEIIGSLVPSFENPIASNTTDDIGISIAELYDNPEKYYNRFVSVAGDLSEYETHLAYAGVGCDTAKYEVSDEFSSDFPSSRHLKDGDKIIGVRIGTHDDLGKVKEPLSDELKSNEIAVMGVFVPSVVKSGSCYHTIHQSGYILADLDEIKILEN